MSVFPLPVRSPRSSLPAPLPVGGEEDADVGGVHFPRDVGGETLDELFQRPGFDAPYLMGLPL